MSEPTSLSREFPYDFDCNLTGMLADVAFPNSVKQSGRKKIYKKSLEQPSKFHLLDLKAAGLIALGVIETAIKIIAGPVALIVLLGELLFAYATKKETVKSLGLSFLISIERTIDTIENIANSNQ